MTRGLSPWPVYPRMHIAVRMCQLTGLPGLTRHYISLKTTMYWVKTIARSQKVSIVYE